METMGQPVSRKEEVPSIAEQAVPEVEEIVPEVGEIQSPPGCAVSRRALLKRTHKASQEKALH